MNEIMMTIKYFDLFNYPLKKDEVFKWLFNYQNIKTLKYPSENSQKLFDDLACLVREGKVAERAGYSFLPPRGEIIKIREERERISLKKISKAQRMAMILGFVPGVKMIAVVSNLGYLNADKDADIDLFIVAEKGKIWGVRFWSVMLMKILGQRPNKQAIKDKICLSYYVTEDNLNLEQTTVAEPDIHLVYLAAQYLPLYSEDEMWEKYVRQNGWLKKYLLNFEYTDELKKFIIKPRLLWLKRIITRTELGFEQRFYKEIQLRKMAAELKQAMNQGDKKVIINDQMLKLHLNDRREEINKMINKII